jgi:hypothetical protein
MDIQTNMQYTFFHGLPPWLWLWAVSHIGSQLNPRLQGAQALTFNHYVYVKHRRDACATNAREIFGAELRIFKRIPLVPVPGFC